MMFVVGADIANICNEAAIFAARDKKKVIEAEDFDHATERVIAGGTLSLILIF